MTPAAIKLHRASGFLLNLSRGIIPKCPCSPYGGLAIDERAVRDEARNAYEIIRTMQPDCIDFSSTG